MTSETDRLRRALEVCVYGPIGVALWLRDLAPNFVTMFVARGRAEVARREEQVQRGLRTVRSAGEVALAFGPGAPRSRTAATPPAGRGARPSRPAAGDAPPANGSRAPILGASGARAAALAIPGYDALSASQVVERLTGLGPGELAAVRDYEAAHRARRTILGKIDQLAVH